MRTLRVVYLAALVIGALTLNAVAQVEVACELDAGSFLKYEPFKANVTIINRSLREIVVGRGGDAALGFEVNRVGRGRVLPWDDNTMQPFVIPPRGKVTKTFNLLRFYDLRNVGSYCVKARLDWMDHYFYSKAQYADVINGAVMDQLVVEHAPSGSFRTFTLERIYRAKEARLFIRIEDPATCYGVLPLGKMLQLYRPEMMEDDHGNVHVLFHSGPNTFERAVVNGTGQIIGRDTLQADAGMPFMQRTDAGEVALSQEFDDE